MKHPFSLTLHAGCIIKLLGLARGVNFSSCKTWKSRCDTHLRSLDVYTEILWRLLLVCATKIKVTLLLRVDSLVAHGEFVIIGESLQSFGPLTSYLTILLCHSGNSL